MDGDGDGVAAVRADVGAEGPAPPLVVDDDATAVVIRQHRRQLAAQGAAIASVNGRVDEHGVALSSVEAHVEGASTALRQQQRLSSALSSHVEKHDIALASVEARVEAVSVTARQQQRQAAAHGSRLRDHDRRIVALEHGHGRVLGPVPFPSHILRRPDATTPTPGTRSSPSLPVFVGRDAQLTQLRAAFERAAERGVGMRHAVVGLGGVGKTQLVKEYVSRWGVSYPRGVLWLEADSMSSLYGGYRAGAVAAEAVRRQCRRLCGQRRHGDASCARVAVCWRRLAAGG